MSAIRVEEVACVLVTPAFDSDADFLDQITPVGARFRLAGSLDLIKEISQSSP